MGSINTVKVSKHDGKIVNTFGKMKQREAISLPPSCPPLYMGLYILFKALVFHKTNPVRHQRRQATHLKPFMCDIFKLSKRLVPN